jgi:hypothetical protein
MSQRKFAPRNRRSVARRIAEVADQLKLAMLDAMVSGAVAASAERDQAAAYRQMRYPRIGRNH